MAVINLASFVTSIPLATRTLCGLVLFFSTLVFILQLTRTDEGLQIIPSTKYYAAVSFPSIVLVPGVSFYYPWTLLTAGFAETGFFGFLVTAITLPLAGRYFERIWGPIELIRFTVIVVVGSNLIAWFLAVLSFVVFRSEVAFYGTQYHGLEALQTAFLVAFAQLIPDHQVQLFKSNLVVFRVRDLPMLYVTFSNIACLLGFISPFILIQFGWLISWVYLRFYRWNPDSGTRGDRSEAFSFVLWFPPFLHTPVGYLSNFLHGIFTRLKLIPEFKYDYVSAADLELGLTGANGAEMSGGNVSARAEAERRRALALKALDQRMTSSGGPSRSASYSTPAANDSGSSVPANQAATAAARDQPPAEVMFQAPVDSEAAPSAKGKVSGSGASTSASAAAPPPPPPSQAKAAAAAAGSGETEADWPESDDEGEGGDGDLGGGGGGGGVSNSKGKHKD